MRAFGENNEKGADHENSERKPDCCAEAGVEMGGEARATAVMERQRRKRQAAKKRERMAILGGRMLVVVAGVRAHWLLCSVARNYARSNEV